ncbi:MAG: hypothetical protein CMC08_04585 [Flavobacteriaceae bacterium]|mgnify:CR=1 FL=1|nr:hypothetical protein [Flavobacteriaceae bacterium]
MRKIVSFMGLLLLVLAIALGIHLAVRSFLGIPLWDHRIGLAYAANFLLAGVILVAVYRTLKNKSSLSGFVFIAGSGLKFVVFFLLFYPHYQADGIMHTAEFITFFIPYALSLILEVTYLSKQLNNQVY